MSRRTAGRGKRLAVRLKRGGTVTQVGKTLLKGHALRGEGAVVWLASGYVANWPPPGTPLHAKCSCGALSPAGISKAAAQRWHREHKDSLR